MKDTGWIHLHREFKSSVVWANGTPEQKIIFIVLLTMANYCPKNWEWKGRSYTVKAGQFITSAKSIVNECRCEEITERKVRIALARFQRLGFLTYETSNKNTLITIVNWDKYQNTEPNDESKMDDSPKTVESHAAESRVSDERKADETQAFFDGGTDGSRVLTIKNEKNKNNENNDNNFINTENKKKEEELSTERRCAVSEWNSLETHDLSKVLSIVPGSERSENLDKVLKQFGIDAFYTAVDNIKTSDFLKGSNKTGWKVTFDWFIRPNNFQKVLEGNYNTAHKEEEQNPFRAYMLEKERKKMSKWSEDDIFDI